MGVWVTTAFRVPSHWVWPKRKATSTAIKRYNASFATDLFWAAVHYLMLNEIFMSVDCNTVAEVLVEVFLPNLVSIERFFTEAICLLRLCMLYDVSVDLIWWGYIAFLTNPSVSGLLTDGNQLWGRLLLITGLSEGRSGWILGVVTWDVMLVAWRCFLWRALRAVFVEYVELLTFTNTLDLILGRWSELLVLFHDAGWRVLVLGGRGGILIIILTPHLLEHSIAGFRPEVVNSVLAIRHFANRKLTYSDVWLSTIHLADGDHELGDQISIGTGKPRHSSLTWRHCNSVHIRLSTPIEKHLITVRSWSSLG